MPWNRIMVWQQVSPRYVRQDYPGLRAQWYRDVADRGGGELMLWVDADGRVRAFQLSHEEWPSLQHYVADWRAGRELQVGHVDEGERSRPHVKPAPIMRFTPHGNPLAAWRLLGYFCENESLLEPVQRQTIKAVLAEGTDFD
jgi:hypothetical protein